MDTRSPGGLTLGSHEVRISALRQRHVNFDQQIQELRRSPSAAQEIAALKVEKLHIKDEIVRLTH
jgi:hypothetical protein